MVHSCHSAAASRERSQVSSGLKRALLAITSVHCAMAAFFASRSGLMFDDFQNLEIAGRPGSELRYLLIPNYGHLGIGQRLMHQVVLGWLRAQWPAVTAALVTTGLITAVTCWRACRALEARPAWSVAAVAIVLLSPLWGTGWTWWSCGADYFVCIPATFIAFECAVRRIRSGSRKWSAGAVLAVAAALSSRERPLILPVSFALLALALTPDRLTIRSALRQLRETWDLWGSGSLLVAIYLVIQVHGNFLSGQRPGQHPWVTTSPVQLASFELIHASRLIGPALLGILPQYWPNPTAMAAVADATLLELALWSLLVLSRAWRAWVFLLASAVLSVLPLAIGRGGAGEVFALEPRYGVELLPSVAIAFVLFGAEAQAGRLVRWASLLRRWSTGLWTMAGLMAVGSTALSLYSVDQLQTGWQGGAAARARRFRIGVQELSAGSDTAVLDGAVPPGIVGAPMWRNDSSATLSSVVRRVRDRVRFFDESRTEVESVDDEGRVHRQHRAAFTTFERDRLTVIAAEPNDADRARCGDGTPCGFIGVAGNETRGQQALLLEVVWRAHAPEWALPARLLGADGPFARQTPVPASVSAFPTAAIVRLDGREAEAAVGFEVPSAALASVAAVRVATLTPEQ